MFEAEGWGQKSRRVSYAFDMVVKGQLSVTRISLRFVLEEAERRRRCPSAALAARAWRDRGGIHSQ